MGGDVKEDDMYKLNRGTRLAKNFTLAEFACPGSDVIEVDYRLVEKLQRMRDVISFIRGKDTAITIMSGYRTQAYNKKIGGADGSQHMYGKAADIHVEGLNPFEVYPYAVYVGFTGIGVYSPPEDSGSWIHVDVRPASARWGKYKQAKELDSETVYKIKIKDLKEMIT